MATNADFQDVVRGGNTALWLDLLGAPALWLIELQLTYAIVPWACHWHHDWVLQTAWIPFFVGACLVGVFSCRHWLRLATLDADAYGVERARFMVRMGMMCSALFALLILVQGIATFIFPPCLA